MSKGSGQPVSLAVGVYARVEEEAYVAHREAGAQREGERCAAPIKEGVDERRVPGKQDAEERGRSGVDGCSDSVLVRNRGREFGEKKLQSRWLVVGRGYLEEGLNLGRA